MNCVSLLPLAAMSSDIASTLISFLPIVAIIVIFYFLLIRPQRKKDKEVKKMLAELKTGDRITTIGGMYGRVTAIKDDILSIEVGREKTPLTIARWAVRTVENSEADNDLI